MPRLRPVRVLVVDRAALAGLLAAPPPAAPPPFAFRFPEEAWPIAARGLVAGGPLDELSSAALVALVDEAGEEVGTTTVPSSALVCGVLDRAPRGCVAAMLDLVDEGDAVMVRAAGLVDDLCAQGHDAAIALLADEARDDDAARVHGDSDAAAAWSAATAILADARAAGATDVHFVPGAPPAYRVDGKLLRARHPPLDDAGCERLVDALLDDDARVALARDGAALRAFADAVVGRCRVAAFVQRGALAGVVHLARASSIDGAASPDDLPAGLLDAVQARRAGLVLIAGPAGSGRTTTAERLAAALASTHGPGSIALVEQAPEIAPPREALVVARFAPDEADRVRAAGRFDVVVLDPVDDGQDRSRGGVDGEIAVELVERGATVIAVVAAPTARAAIDRFASPRAIDALVAATALRLVPRAGGGLVLAAEVVAVDDAVRAALSSRDADKISRALEPDPTIDARLADLARRGAVSRDDAVAASTSRARMKRLLGG